MDNLAQLIGFLFGLLIAYFLIRDAVAAGVVRGMLKYDKKKLPRATSQTWTLGERDRK